MKVELTEEGYTLDGKWKLVPSEADSKMLDAGVAMALQVSVHGIGGWSKYIESLFSQLLINSPKPVFELEKQLRIGDIYVGGELLPEFNSDNGIHY